MKFYPATLLLAVLLLLLCPTAGFAQQAYGEVAFTNSGPASAQADFLLGLAQLHNFEYDDAAEHFRKAQQIAPDFALAYWAEAMTKNHALWHEEDVAAARAIMNRLVSLRRRGWLRLWRSEKNSTFKASRFCLARARRKSATVD